MTSDQKEIRRLRKLIRTIRDKCADSRKKPGCQNLDRQIYEMCRKEVGE